MRRPRSSPKPWSWDRAGVLLGSVCSRSVCLTLGHPPPQPGLSWVWPLLRQFRHPRIQDRVLTAGPFQAPLAVGLRAEGPFPLRGNQMRELSSECRPRAWSWGFAAGQQEAGVWLSWEARLMSSPLKQPKTCQALTVKLKGRESSFGGERLSPAVSSHGTEGWNKRTLCPWQCQA